MFSTCKLTHFFRLNNDFTLFFFANLRFFDVLLFQQVVLEVCKLLAHGNALLLSAHEGC